MTLTNQSPIPPPPPPADTRSRPHGATSVSDAGTAFTRMIPAFLAPVPAVDPQAAAIAIENLTVRVKGRLLLDSANLRIDAGEVVLLVGGSGTGKSVLIRILLGLVTPDSPGFSISGHVRVEGADILSPGFNRAASRRVGQVFQDNALFDELTIEQNIDFAFDHAQPAWRRADRAKMRDRLGRTLDLPHGTPISRCSGGEKRRIAIARTLAFNPDILLYDEPTTGLDPLNASRVADLIGMTNRSFQKTSLVITHDYEYMRHAADRVIVLDPVAHTLVELQPDEATAEGMRALLSRAPRRQDVQSAQMVSRFRLSPRVLRLVGTLLMVFAVVGLIGMGLEVFPRDENALVVNLAAFALGFVASIKARYAGMPLARVFANFLASTGRVAEQMLTTPLMLVLWPLGIACTPLAITPFPSRLLPWPRPHWALRYYWHYLKLVGLGSATLYLCATGAIVGFVATFFTFRYFPYANYTEELIRDDVMGAIAFLLLRVLVPLICTVLIAARCGAAVAADLGNRVYTSQADAMRTFNVQPTQYWGSNVLWAFLVAGPVLVALAFVCATFASCIAFLVCKADTTVTVTVQEWWIFYSAEIFKTNAPTSFEDLLPLEWHWVVIKTLVCMVATAAVAIGVGMSRKDSTVDVSKGITTTILWATILVLLIHVAFAFFEFTAPGAVT